MVQYNSRSSTHIFLQENFTEKNNSEYKPRTTTLNENYLKNILNTYFCRYEISAPLCWPANSFGYRNGQRNKLGFVIYLHFRFFLLHRSQYTMFSLYPCIDEIFKEMKYWRKWYILHPRIFLVPVLDTQEPSGKEEWICTKQSILSRERQYRISSTSEFARSWGLQRRQELPDSGRRGVYNLQTFVMSKQKPKSNMWAKKFK